MELSSLSEELTIAGLTEDQAEIYLRLLQTGPTRVSKLTPFFDASRSTLYRQLDELAEAGVVNKSLESPVTYEPVSPEELFETGENRIRRSLEQLQAVRENRLETLQSLSQFSDDTDTYNWKKLEGTDRIYEAVSEMIEEADQTVWVASSHEVSLSTYLPDVEQAWRTLARRVRQDDVEGRLLLDLSEDPYEDLPECARGADDLHLREFPTDDTIHFAIVDRQDLMMWVRPAPLGRIGKRDDVAVHTEAPGSVHAHRLLFEQLWDESEPVEVRP